jgi:hypothetical protein
VSIATPKRTYDVLPKPDNFKSYRHTLRIASPEMLPNHDYCLA